MVYILLKINSLVVYLGGKNYKKKQVFLEYNQASIQVVEVSPISWNCRFFGEFLGDCFIWYLIVSCFVYCLPTAVSEQW